MERRSKGWQLQGEGVGRRVLGGEGLRAGEGFQGVGKVLGGLSGREGVKTEWTGETEGGNCKVREERFRVLDGFYGWGGFGV